MIITKIQRIRGKRTQYCISFDGAPALEISDWTIGKFGLRTGDEMDECRLETLRTAETEMRAKNIAINFLSYRPRSSKEVIDHLIKKGFDRHHAETVTQQLQESGLIDDEKFARLYIRDRIRQKPTGQALLRQKLFEKGISADQAERILRELITVKGQQAAAQEALKRKLRLSHPTRKKSDAEKQRKRLLDFLVRRGFSFDIAMKTIRTTLDH